MRDSETQGRYTVRCLTPEDYWTLRDLEGEIFGDEPAGALCPHYLRLCTDHYGAWCFLVLDGETPAGYVLNFPCGKTNYCATLAVRPAYRKSRVNYLLVRATVQKLLREGMRACRFLVAPENAEARSVHESLGARVVGTQEDCYVRGDRRLWSVIDEADLEALRAKYTRLRLVS